MMRTILIITITVCFLAGATTTHSTEFDGLELLAAASAGDIETIELLLEQGVNVDFQDEEGVTALIVAAFMGHEKVVTLLIEAGADLDVQDTDEWTALITAAWEGHAESAQWQIF